MANKHLYLAVENIGLTNAQRDTFVDALKQLGPDRHQQPACLCHWRIRLDNQAAIFEALFNENALTVDAFKNRLATIFNVDPSTITDTVQSTQYGPLVIFARSGDRLRFLLFGGVNATWMESGDACRAYLAANRDEWESEL